MTNETPSRDPRHDDDLRLLDAPEEFEGSLARFLAEARDELTEAPHPFTRTRHLAAVHAAARERQKTQVGWLTRVRTVLGLTGVKIAVAATAAAAAAGGGAAATGNLPAPAQTVVADVADQVGLDLPRPEQAPPFDEEDGPGSERGQEAREHGLDTAREAWNRGNVEFRPQEVGPPQNPGQSQGQPDDPGAAAEEHRPDQADAAEDNRPDNVGEPQGDAADNTSGIREDSSADEAGPPEDAPIPEDPGSQGDESRSSSAVNRPDVGNLPVQAR